MKNKFVKYFDIFFLIVSVFLVALIWFRSYFHNNTQIIIYSLSISAILGICFAIFTNKKEEKIFYEKKYCLQEKLMEKTLMLNDEIENYLLIKNANNFDLSINNNYALMRKNEGVFAIKIEFNQNMLTYYDILKIYKQIKEKNLKKIIILCKNFDKTAIDFCQNVPQKIEILNAKNSYLNFFKDKYEFSEKDERKNKKEIFKNFLFIAFNSSKTKSYLFASIVLFIGCIFLRYNIYYLIWTSIMFLFAIFSYFNKPFNSKLKTNIFD